mmetsp:Transcript_22351/g.60408  ORF Transcript_22351/g.60408 Transcript_22351/m.60408 type:complete len:204 (-) Transcript_22351:68-679(-)
MRFCRVGGQVELGDEVEEEGLLAGALGQQSVHEVLQSRQLGQELLHHLAEGLEDGLVVDGGEKDAQGHVEAAVGHLLGELLVHVALCLELLVLGEGVTLVHKHLSSQVGVGVGGHHERSLEPRDGLRVIVLHVDDPDESRAGGEDRGPLGRLLSELSGARRREIPDLELQEGAVRDVCLDDLGGTLQEERLVRRHLVEDDLLD